MLTCQRAAREEEAILEDGLSVAKYEIDCP
jgi:hypothetical protein